MVTKQEVIGLLEETKMKHLKFKNACTLLNELSDKASDTTHKKNPDFKLYSKMMHARVEAAERIAFQEGRIEVLEWVVEELI